LDAAVDVGDRSDGDHPVILGCPDYYPNWQACILLHVLLSRQRTCHHEPAMADQSQRDTDEALMLRERGVTRVLSSACGVCRAPSYDAVRFTAADTAVTVCRPCIERAGRLLRLAGPH
jgi:hypothetical protein